MDRQVKSNATDTERRRAPIDKLQTSDIFMRGSASMSRVKVLCEAKPDTATGGRTICILQASRKRCGPLITS